MADAGGVMTMDTARGRPGESPPPGAGFSTVTVALVGAAVAAADTAAVSWLALTYWVGSAAPFHWTTEVETKLPPVTRRGIAPSPMRIGEGESEVGAGTGLSMLTVASPDVPPPGGGFTTATRAVPAPVKALAGTS